MTTRRVVVGVDGSLLAVRALDRAAEEAALRGAALEIGYAVPDPDVAGPVLQTAVSRARARHPGLEATAVPLTGEPARALADLGRDAALTVVGSRGFGGFAGLLLGSVSLRLAAYTESPLLVVRRDAHPAEYGEVLLGIESDEDADASAYAFEEAERRHARLRIVHAWTYRYSVPDALVPVPATSVQEDINRQAAAEEAVPGFTVAGLREKHPRVGIETRTVRSGPVHALLNATRTADVVVIASHRRPGEGRYGFQLGHVTRALLHHAHCSVVVVPSPAEES
ncbi:universal stress protein [Streptomyces sp. WAC 00631]|uniref:universal stress protein n=1 Tax=Streptomyces sp. WAC 00631 TaxID=2203201 RepID=UPI00163C0939|nr:universal stress protein [Streptomyces sp. WAC 00631]MCC5033865.1 universal stress protein [Streptomyces sp. WAC 00631]